MSIQLVVYQVSPDKLRSALNSHDSHLVQSIKHDQQYLLERADEATGGELSCAQAVEELINGTNAKEGWGGEYAFAYEVICAQVGKRVGDFPFSGNFSKSIEAFDATLAQKGISLSLVELCFRGALFASFEGSGDPSIGYWKGKQLDAAWPRLQEVIAAETAAKSDPDFLDALVTIREWISKAKSHSGDYLIGRLA